MREPRSSRVDRIARAVSTAGMRPACRRPLPGARPRLRAHPHHRLTRSGPRASPMRFESGAGVRRAVGLVRAQRGGGDVSTSSEAVCRDRRLGDAGNGGGSCDADGQAPRGFRARRETTTPRPRGRPAGRSGRRRGGAAMMTTSAASLRATSRGRRGGWIRRRRWARHAAYLGQLVDGQSRAARRIR